MAFLYYLLLLGIAILPVVLLMVFIYRQDKYQKEPVKSLIKAFIGGMIAIPLDIIIVTMLDLALGETFLAQTVFFSAFMEAGIVTRTSTNTSTASSTPLSSVSVLPALKTSSMCSPSVSAQA